MEHAHPALNVPDVLSRIMELSLPRPSRGVAALRSTKIPSTKMVAEPWTFLLVSKFWNEVTLGTPSLWSSFVVVARDPRYQEIFHLPSVLEAHLKRSGSVPLTVVMSFSFKSAIDDIELNPLDVIRVLYRKAEEGQHRWQDVMFKLSARGDFSAAPFDPINLRIHLSEAPILNSLDIEIDILPRYLRTNLELSHCPLLNTVSITGPVDITNREPDDGRESRSNGFFPSLTKISIFSFELEARSLAGYWPLLNHAQNIEVIDLHIAGIGETSLPAPLPMIVFPKLQKLDMEFPDAMHALRSMSVPSLTKLELDTMITRNDTFVTLATNLRTVPVKHLVLKLSGPLEEPIEATTLLTFMESVGGLRHLEIEDSSITFLKIFYLALRSSLESLESSSTSPLPNLVKLEFKISSKTLSEGISATSIQTLKDIILECSRRYSNFHLRMRFIGSYRNEVKAKELSRIVDIVLNDSQVMSCCSETFKIQFNRPWLNTPEFLELH